MSLHFSPLILSLSVFFSLSVRLDYFRDQVSQSGIHSFYFVSKTQSTALVSERANEERSVISSRPLRGDTLDLHGDKQILFSVRVCFI